MLYGIQIMYLGIIRTLLISADTLKTPQKQLQDDVQTPKAHTSFMGKF